MFVVVSVLLLINIIALVGETIQNYRLSTLQEQRIKEEFLSVLNHSEKELDDEEILAEKQDLLKLVNKENPSVVDIQSAEQKGKYININAVLSNNDVRMIAYKFEDVMTNSSKLNTKMNEKKAKFEVKQKEITKNMNELNKKKAETEMELSKYQQFNFINLFAKRVSEIFKENPSVVDMLKTN